MLGRTLSHYRIEAELGRGGMGVLYRAHDQRLRRPVALKLLANEITSSAGRARLLAEARAAAALNHPGVVTVYEVGEEGEQVFIVMELVSGRTLRELIRVGPTDPPMIARLGAQIAEVLAAAHTQGVVHGDVKPENIFVQPDGHVKLVDFGLSRCWATETATITRTAAAQDIPPDSKIAGTLAYMAPEQMRGEPGDARSDLWSLGITLYELAAGRRPFLGQAATSLMAQILGENPPPLSAAAGAVPADLSRIVHKLLEKQSERRYQSAREVSVDLANLLRDIELGAVLPPAAAGKRALAVLPFKLLTPSLEDEYLGVALADAIINHLSVSDELLVRPASAVQRYAQQVVDPLLVARELNVQVIIDGSIQKLGQRLRVHVGAWNAADGGVLLSAKYDSEMANLFSLQDSIAAELARALGTRAALERATQLPTRNPTAYELFLRAVERLTRLNRWDTRTAIEMLEQAVKLDPQFADAWARLGEACRLMGVTFEPRPHWIRQAERAIRRALALEPRNAEAVCARGLVLWTPAKGFQHRAALRAFREAVRANPRSHQALVWQGCIFLHVGLLEEAKQVLAAALASNPDDAFTLAFYGQTAFYRGDYEEAETYFTRLLRVDPANMWGNLMFAPILLYSDKLDKAAEMIRLAQQIIPGDSAPISCEALLLAKRGETRKAEQAIQRALRGCKSLLHTHHTVHHLAAAYGVLGKADKAVALLRQASRTGLPNYPLFRDDPHFRFLQDHARFRSLLAELKGDWQRYKREFGPA